MAYVLFALPNRFILIGPRKHVHQALVRPGVEHHGFGLPMHCQHERALRLFEVPQDFDRVIPKRRKRLDIFCNAHRRHGGYSWRYFNVPSLGCGRSSISRFAELKPSTRRTHV
jgi:hypothetical protein